MDDTLVLFKGEVDADTLFNKWSYKKLTTARDVRIKRLIKERKEQEEINKQAEAEAARNGGM